MASCHAYANNEYMTSAINRRTTHSPPPKRYSWPGSRTHAHRPCRHADQRSNSSRPRPTSSAGSWTARRRSSSRYAPEYVSCTFGAGGSTLSYTSETVRHLKQSHRLRRRAASVVHGRQPRGDPRAAARCIKRAGLPAHRRAARRPALRHGRTMGDLRYGADLVRIHPRRCTATSSIIEVGAYPETHPQADDALQPICGISRRRSTPVRMRRSPSISTTRTRISASSTTCAGSA